MGDFYAIFFKSKIRILSDSLRIKTKIFQTMFFLWLRLNKKNAVWETYEVKLKISNQNKYLLLLCYKY